MLTTTDPRGHARSVRLASAPRGPRGLWGALAVASSPRVAARALPLCDLAKLGVAAPTMFDYDPAGAVPLGELFDPAALLD